MRCLRCGECCLETEMLLSTEDLAKLEKKGYKKEFFARVDKAAYTVLRNSHGCCVFFDVENRRCKVYSERPSGCRVYPVIYDEDKGLVADNVCHVRGAGSEKEKGRKGKKGLGILGRIEGGARQKS